MEVETSKNVKYWEGNYKYQVRRFAINLNEYLDPEMSALRWVEKAYESNFIIIYPDGLLIIKTGYGSDGPSGPTIDRKTFMRGAFTHDGLYQLIRMGVLPMSFRKVADIILKNICIEDGMWKWWAKNVVYRGVRYGGGPAAAPKNKRKLLTAPF